MPIGHSPLKFEESLRKKEAHNKKATEQRMNDRERKRKLGIGKPEWTPKQKKLFHKF